VVEVEGGGIVAVAVAVKVNVNVNVNVNGGGGLLSAARGPPHVSARVTGRGRAS
jgi:hypothetical protein